MKKVVLIGPESTGKTTLAKELAAYYQTALVEEFAREYIEQLDRAYEKDDLLKIAKGQLEKEDLAIINAEKVLICDTDLIVIEIWSEVKFGEVNEWITQQILTRNYDLYLLCGTDIPWEFDVQREHPNFRAALYQRYFNRLTFYKKRFIELKGGQVVRLTEAITEIDKLL